MKKKLIKNNEKITIVLPNYNSYKFIENTVNSIIKQSYKKWELIIVDDCSEKKTVTILKNFKKNKKIKFIFLKKNKGAGYCRNLAIKKSKSDYLAFIDADDLWHKDKLLEQINFMKVNKYEFSYTYYTTFNDRNSSTRNIKTPYRFNFETFIKNTSIATSTMIVKRSLSTDVKFSNSKICEDYYYKCQLLKKIKFAYCFPKFFTKYQIRNNSLQSSRIRNLYWMWKINNSLNNFNIFKNLISLFLISFNSLKKYGFR